MTVYVVALLNITDRAEYQRYGEGFMEIFNRYDGQLLAVDESPTVVEGAWPHTRTVLASFPSAEAMNAWYDSPEYQALAQHRFNASTASIALVKGLG
jgi:uncharacterized protein (DUF1330 family)